MNGGYACWTGEDTKSASFHAEVRGLCASLGTPSEPPPSSGRSETATQPYANADAYADTLAAPASFTGDHPNWCVDAGSALLTMTTFELWESLERGEVLPWMRVWREGMECWTPVGEIAEFTWAIAGTPAPPSGPSALPASSPASGTDAGPLVHGDELPPDSAIRPAAPGALGRRRNARWVALGSAVAIAAVASAFFLRRTPPPPAPAAPFGAQSSSESVPAPAADPAPPVAPQPLGAELLSRHDERGQRRQPRGGHRAYGR